MIRIVTDSVASITKEKAEELGIEVVTLYVHYKGQEYLDATMDVDAFYADIYNMLDDIPTSSQPSAADFESVFESAATAGDSVIGIFISTGLSGTVDGALRAARNVKSNHIDFKYTIIDSRSCGTDEGLSVIDAAIARNTGANFEECIQAALQGIENSRFLFAPESLTFLKKGGRIGEVAALLGNLIQITPVVTVSDGKAKPAAKVRTYTKTLARMTEMFEKDVKTLGLTRAFVHYIGSPEQARKWAKEVIEPIVGHEVEVLPVSPVIGLHVGPAVGVAYECLEKIKGKISINPRKLAFSA